MKYALVILTALALMTTPAFGQEEMDERWDDGVGPLADDWEFIIAGSGVSGNDVDAGDFRIDAELGKYLTDALAVYLRQNVTYDDDNMGTDVDFSTRIALDYHFDLGKFRPFIGGNAGFFYGDRGEDTWGYGPEAGAKWYADNNTFIFGRVEYQFLEEDLDEVDIDDGQFIYTLGIGFNF